MKKDGAAIVFDQHIAVLRLDGFDPSEIQADHVDPILEINDVIVTDVVADEFEDISARTAFHAVIAFASVQHILAATADE